MNKTKTHIHVFVTKKFLFRATIKEPDKPEYEVTVGGKSWRAGKGRKYQATIDYKISEIINKLSIEQLNLNNN